MASPMYEVPPPESPNAEDATALNHLDRLNAFLGTAAARNIMENCHHNKRDTSITRIQAGRYEIFVSDVVGKDSTCFDRLIRKAKLPTNAKQCILEYAERQARKDNRITPDYKFQNFSIIWTFGESKKQAAHMDSLYPNFQFGLALTNGSKATYVYLANVDVSNIQDVQTLWNEWNDGQHDMPPNLIQAFASSKEATRLLESFGKVLVPEKDLQQVEMDHALSTGSLLSMPGSVVHAGPDACKTRGILFFSACPEAGAVYNQEQFTGPVLVAQLVTLLWKSPGVGLVEREYMLYMIAKYMRQDCDGKVASCASHFSIADDFVGFLKQLETDSLSDDEVQALIHNTAKDQDLCVPNVEGDFELVSVEGLYCTWEPGRDYPIAVHRRPCDDKILVEYLDGKDEYWEGLEDDVVYRLEMNVDGAKFDGSNGRLLDADGDEVSCYCRKMSKRARRERNY